MLIDGEGQACCEYLTQMELDQDIKPKSPNPY